MIRLLLVDDQTLVRSGIRGLLELTRDIRAVAGAGYGSEADALLKGVAFDPVLQDVRMPSCTGIDMLRAWKGRLLPPILLTTFDDDQAFLDGMRLGVRGLLLKDISLEKAGRRHPQRRERRHAVAADIDGAHARLGRTRRTLSSRRNVRHCRSAHGARDESAGLDGCGLLQR